ncbi:kinase-like domain-containing protein [Suillus discolor]|uniref:Kinase-like domain-containing protein n=1 Tax=Suillus discolor TaxID=1912936 RepID=A0A9P7EWA1_9AGAM|nr:kinase-like domain-containing protein [Suillus discolor]KAG2094669.1 kinase-like domain-containing protein [Suillus discolor]
MLIYFRIFGLFGYIFSHFWSFCLYIFAFLILLLIYFRIFGPFGYIFSHFWSFHESLFFFYFRGHGIVVLEHLGHNLKKYMKSCGGSLPIGEVYVLGKALVKLFQDIHDQGVIHCDVKPEDILLWVNGKLQPYLVDFGHAKLYHDQTRKHKLRSVMWRIQIIHTWRIS